MNAPLIDPFARAITYLRVSVTDRCDFRCVYCMSEDMKFLPKKDLLTLEELDRMCSTFVSLGVEKLRITGGEPLALEALRARYEAQTRGSGDGDEVWHNWIVRIADSRRAIGFVQATVIDGDAELAWTIGLPWQGQGYASEAALALVVWARSVSLDRLSARIAPGHLASEAVALACGLGSTGELDEDGEQLWQRRLG